MTAADTDRTILDGAMPRFDAAIAKHVMVAADPATTYEAARTLDLLTVRTPLLAVSMWIRALPARLLGRAAPSLPELTVVNGGLPGWLALGERQGREIAFGAVGKFWQAVIEWLEVQPSEFSEFTEPGWGKISANFVVIPYGERSALLRYECRTITTDPVSRRRFLRYWRFIRPFVGHIMQATVNQIKADAEGSK
ncbi:hypothetical protein [Mycobacterium sp. MMS18-G62]